MGGHYLGIEIGGTKLQHLHTIVLVGNKKGRHAEIGDTAIVVDDGHYGSVEDAHMGICNIIAYAFMDLANLQKV